MSLITRCPACTTLFKVVPDQLRISDGWVRCGLCSEIFDASLNLIEPGLEPAPSIKPVLIAEPVATLVDLTTELSVSPELASITSISDQQESFPVIPESQSPVAQFKPIPELATPTSAELGPVSFLQPNKPVLSWHHSSRQRQLVWACAVLLLGLIGQWLYQERNRLVLANPGLMPVLQAICKPLNCSLLPFQNIESMVIDSAVFTKLGKDGFLLMFAVKNAASIELALPDIEVTLTDVADQPIARRVVTHEQLGSNAQALAAHQVWPVSMALRINADAELVRVVGYRLVAFYP